MVRLLIIQVIMVVKSFKIMNYLQLLEVVKINFMYYSINQRFLHFRVYQKVHFLQVLMSFDFEIDYWIINQTQFQNQVCFMLVSCLSIQKVQLQVELQLTLQKGCLQYHLIYRPPKNFTIQKLIIHLFIHQKNLQVVAIEELMVNQKDFTDPKLGFKINCSKVGMVKLNCSSA